jgi:phosphate transport system permease protein
VRRVILADRIATGTLWAIGILVVAILGAIILHFVLAALGTFSLSFLFGNPSDTTVGGIGPILWNSLYILVLTMLITVPLGIAGGIYMAEYAGTGRLTDAIRLSQELISSVPSIVVGLFGLALFVNATHWSFTALGGALTLTVFNLPLMSRLTEQALRAVPTEERNGSLALGCTKWQTIQHVVLPLAIPGIVTGAYNFANFNLTDARSPWSPFHPATTLSVYIWKLNSEGLGDFVRQIADTSSAVLVVLVLVFNLGARGLGRVLQRHLTSA